MLNSSKKRPDTLELGTIGSSFDESSEENKQLGANKFNKTSRYKQKPDINISPIPKDQKTVTVEAPQLSVKRWFHYARKSRRKNEESENVTVETAIGHHQQQIPTLAKAEQTVIANSVNTVLENPQLLADVPNVETKLPKESLQSFATQNFGKEYDHHWQLTNSDQQSHEYLQPEFIETESDTLIPDEEKAQPDLLENSAADFVSGGPSNTANANKLNVNDAHTDRTRSIQTRLSALCSKLSNWKNRNKPQRSGSEASISNTTFYTDTNVGEKNSSKVNDENLKIRLKTFQRKPSSSDNSLAAMGIRRLSQIRRRRSSYYFSENERRIRANDREFNAQFKYSDNYIKTSKYSLFTFLPFNLLEQFQRLANFYFLCLLVLQLIPAISSLTPVTTAIPLIGVLTLTAVKDAYDDIQRHLSDSQVNNRKSKTLRNGKLIDEKWSGVQVGDVIRMENNQFVAADILLLTTSEPNGLCFIETAELDGETNLKCKQCLPETIELSQHHELLWNFSGEIICERPNNLLNKFEGTLLWKNQRFSLDNEKILLRGCVLRNTQWCYGVVIFAGEDTKLMQNSGKTQFKSTGVDRLLNSIIIGIVLFLISICAFFTIACAIWEFIIGQHFQGYLPWENIIPKKVSQGATVIGLLVFFSYAIVLNTVVPISLYVSVEVIRFVQSFLINWDEEMYHDRTKTHAKARTTTLNEELGQIQYIFSDKTGTLTQNIMTFNKCSINGRSYGDVIDLSTGEVIETTSIQNNKLHATCTPNNTYNASQTSTKILHAAEVHNKNTSLCSMPTTPEQNVNYVDLKVHLQGNRLVTTNLKKSIPKPKIQRSVSIQEPYEKYYMSERFPTSSSTTKIASISENNGSNPNYDAESHSNEKKTKFGNLFKRNVTFSSTVKPPFRRTMSTLSKNDDKVMILNDMLLQDIPKELPKKKSIVVTQSQQNNNRTITEIADSTTFAKYSFITTTQSPPTNNLKNLKKIKSSPTLSSYHLCCRAPCKSSAYCHCDHVEELDNDDTVLSKSRPACTCANSLNIDSNFRNKFNNINILCENHGFLSKQQEVPTQQHNQHKHQHQKLHAMEPVDFSSNPEYEQEFRWYDRTLLDAVRADEEHAHNFFRLLALCHTVMPEYIDGRLEYQAQSPDESALVSAARNFGFVFRSRTPNSITIEVMGRTEEYELLHILDFNNVRKRMSVILRRGNNIVLYCKGADNVIYDRLSTSQNDVKVRTQDHLNKFAGEGLRTLVLAERRLDENYFEDWRKRHQEAAVSLQAREDKINFMYEEIESEMELVGVTAIEDKLQDGVPQAIANLQMAGIKIWVLTGDKQETAINIGYSCQLLTDDLADVFIVDGLTMEEVDKQLRQFKESIRIVNRFRPNVLEPVLNLDVTDVQDSRSNTAFAHHAGPFKANLTPPPPPAISVVTFSAECSELYNNLEKGSQFSPKHKLKEDDIFDDTSGFAIVINGHSLVHCLAPELESRFLDIASQCKAVICCRVTPLQKALVVELIKRAKKAVTLAIGDGANDVSMIKAAHIGVGISGQEGLQAVLASDYSIAQFRFLERLLLVHGRWSYYRMCKFLRYFFYKNFAFTLCHCWYSFFCGFSAQTVFDPMFISVYNLFYTSLPVLALGIFEQDVSDKLSVEYPKLYTPGLKSELFNIREFVYSVMHGCFSSLILFLIPYGTYKDGVSPNGFILSDHMTLGAVVATILIIDNTAQIALYTSYWTVFNHIMIWGSLIWYFLLDYFYNYVIGGPYVGSLTQAMKDLTFWATMFITVVVIMAPVLAYKFYLLDVHPQLSDKIRLKRRQATLRSRHDVIRTPSARRARRSLRSGYAFAHQEGFGRLITSGKIMRKLPQEFAFPLGLGSKKIQNNNMTTTASAPNQNNNDLRDNKNSSTGDLNCYSNGNGNRGTISADLSPRAPCQDLDTINL